DRAPPIQLGEERLVLRRAEILSMRVRQEDDTGGVQRIERVWELVERSIDVGQRERREEAQPIAVILGDPRGQLVHPTGLRASDRITAGRWVQVDPRGRHGEDRPRDVVAVHEREGILCRPGRELAPPRVADALRLEPRGVRWRDDVLMDVDTSVGHVAHLLSYKYRVKSPLILAMGVPANVPILELMYL